MKNRTRFLLPGAILLALFFQACEKDYLAPQEEVTITDSVSFQADILPILTANCATSNCHDGSIPPELTAASAYDDLVNLGYVDVNNPSESVVYKRITSKTNPMPPSGSLSGTEIGYILAWIEQGAQNN